MITTYHNHSSWSDGASSIREMALAAKAAGAAEFGISDHLVSGPRAFFLESRTWSMGGYNLLDSYVTDALAVKAELDSPEFRVRIGLETDYFPETVDAVNRRLAQLPLDYVIGAVHFAGDFPIDASAGYWRRLSPVEQSAVWHEYVRRMSACAEKLQCNWLAHLDLAKIYCVAPPAECLTALKALLKRCGELGLCIEINTAGCDKPCGEQYPSRELLETAVESGVGILVNADAHKPEQIVRHFGQAYALLDDLGVKRQPTFEKRQCFWHDRG